jgi:hypothetical protein
LQPSAPSPFQVFGFQRFRAKTLTFSQFSLAKNHQGLTNAVAKLTDCLQTQFRKTCKRFKVIQGFTREVSTCHLFFVQLAQGQALPRGVEIALSVTRKNVSSIHVFFRLENFHVFASCLLDWLTAGLIPLPFQPVGRCVEYCIILQHNIFAPLQSPGARQHVLALSEAIRLVQPAWLIF